MSVSFEQFIMQCCKSQEGKLRKWLRRILNRYDFTIKEDGYVSDRAKNNESYKKVHNLLAVRGNPTVCLVAHTDICRDHNKSNKIHYGNPEKIPNNMVIVDPTIKLLETEDYDGKKILKRIIQDRHCNTQVGGDDRLGVAINTWIAINSGYDMALLFTTDEEIGLRSARQVNFPELKNYELCVQVDRGNRSNELVNKIHDTILCDYDTIVNLLEIAYDINAPRRVVSGAGTDIVAMKERNIIKNAVNMTCGYHDSHGDSGNEYICVEEATSTMRYVAQIIKNYNIKNIK